MWRQYGEKDMRVVDILPVQLGVAMYPEHEKVKSLLIDEIESHGDDYEPVSYTHLRAHET